MAGSFGDSEARREGGDRQLTADGERESRQQAAGDRGADERAPQDESRQQADGTTRKPRIGWFVFGEHDEPLNGHVLTVDDYGRVAEHEFRNGVLHDSRGDAVDATPTYWLEILASHEAGGVDPLFEFDWAPVDAHGLSDGEEVVGFYTDDVTLRRAFVHQGRWYWSCCGPGDAVEERPAMWAPCRRFVALRR